MRYFLTGATSFLGHAISRQLAAAGHEAVTVARRPERARFLVELGVEVVPGDTADRYSMVEAMKGVDGLFHTAGWNRFGGTAKERLDAEKINVEATRNVLSLANELKIPKTVYTSSLGVFGDTKGRVVTEAHRLVSPWLPLQDQTRRKGHFEVAVPMIEQRMPMVIVMPGVMYGPGDAGLTHTMILQHLRRKMVFSPLKTAFCWAHVEDVARGHILAMEKGKPGETYIIGGPVHTVSEALAVVSSITGLPAPKGHPGPLAMQSLAGFMAAFGWLVRPPEAYSSEGLRALAGTTNIGSSEKAERELGFSARSLAAGIGDAIEHERLMMNRV